MDQNELKQQAAVKAASLVPDQIVLGLGTGSTVAYLVEAIAKRIQNEHLTLTGVTTSERTLVHAKRLGIPMKAIDEVEHIDLTIDGADEVDRDFQGIKGGGAAHLFEKIVALNSNRNIWIIDESKLVDHLGAFPLPLEVIPYGNSKVFSRLEAEGLHPKFRVDAKGERVLTDSENYVIDLHLEEIKHPHLLASWLDHQTGILEHGLFLDIVNQIVVGTANGPKLIDCGR